ncbi:MAG: septation ring formation regulator EzrA [Akkermansiaceae bacterium]|jgi:septation ring formation regulator EzrA
MRVEFDLEWQMFTLRGMTKYSIFALMALATVSCKKAGDSVEMKRYQEKKAEVEALQTELKELRVKIEEAKVDPPEIPVEQLVKELEETSAAVAKLQGELKGLGESEKEAREKLESYQKKYPLGGE